MCKLLVCKYHLLYLNHDFPVDIDIIWKGLFKIVLALRNNKGVPGFCVRK
jgi:hypothetical protein